MLLREQGFNTVHELEAIRNNNYIHQKEKDRVSADKDGSDINGGLSPDDDSDFDCLLKMPLSNLTCEKIDDLNKEASKTESDLKEI
jgi:hypothetical protein